MIPQSLLLCCTMGALLATEGEAQSENFGSPVVNNISAQGPSSQAQPQLLKMSVDFSGNLNVLAQQLQLDPEAKALRRAAIAVSFVTYFEFLQYHTCRS